MKQKQLQKTATETEITIQELWDETKAEQRRTSLNSGKCFKCGQS